MKILSKSSVWCLAAGLFFILTSVRSSAPPQAKADWANVGKIVAIGDIHGAYDEFVAILQELGLLDAKLTWTGGKTHLVQTGDSIDRGPQDKKVLDLLIELEKQAEKAGGRVHALLGNHEAMNVMGDLRYVAPEAFAAFASDKADELREKAYSRYVKYRAARAERTLPPTVFTPDAKFKEEWMAKHPPGYFEQRRAFSDTGVYGRWIANRNVVLKLNDTIFLHGGLAGNMATISLRDINDRVRRELKNFQEVRTVLVRNGVLDEALDYDEAVQQVLLEFTYRKAKGVGAEPELAAALQQFQMLTGGLLLHPDGPLWYRGYDKEAEETFKPVLERLKTSFGVAHFVVGHTPSLSGIKERFASGVYLIDTGMLRRYYRGRCAALVIENGTFTPVYPKSGPCA